MKKYYLFFITLLCASIVSLFVRSSQDLPKGEMTFSLKNSGKSGQDIFFIMVNGGKAQMGPLKLEEFRDGTFDTAGTTRLYIWEENIKNWTSPELREGLKEMALASHDTRIDQIDFAFKPNWFFKFPTNKAIHVKWKNNKLQTRDGKTKFAPKKGMGKYTEEGYSLRNNVTKDDVRDSSWKFDAENGQWLNNEIIVRGKLDKIQEGLGKAGI